MGSENKKIKGIVKELLSNALEAESSDINIDIKRASDQTIITIKDDGNGMNNDALHQVRNVLNQPRRNDIEEYYGGLAGNSPTSSGLNVVSTLVDEAEVNSRLGKGTIVKVVRYTKK